MLGGHTVPNQRLTRIEFDAETGTIGRGKRKLAVNITEIGAFFPPGGSAERLTVRTKSLIEHVTQVVHRPGVVLSCFLLEKLRRLSVSLRFKKLDAVFNGAGSSQRRNH